MKKINQIKIKHKGFTLLEIMVVVVIIAVMAAAVVPSIIGKLDEASISRTKTDIKSIETALKLYRASNFSYPSTDQGLEALVSKPSGDPEPRSWSQQLPKAPIDPWKNPYKYISPGTRGGDFDLYSLGPDGIASDDDIGNWDLDN